MWIEHPLLASPASACNHPYLNVEHTLSSVCRRGAVRMVLETSCTGFPASCSWKYMWLW
ncbi:hypothetical protein M405DRAFT_824692, partial [Rhizopogon salebrosus TDB-379]